MEWTPESTRPVAIGDLPLHSATPARLLAVLVEDRAEALWPIISHDPVLAVRFLTWAHARGGSTEAPPVDLLEELRAEALARWIAEAACSQLPALDGRRPTGNGAGAPPGAAHPDWTLRPPSNTCFDEVAEFCVSAAHLAEELARKQIVSGTWSADGNGTARPPARRRPLHRPTHTQPRDGHDTGWLYLTALVSRLGMLAFAAREPNYHDLLARSATLHALCEHEREAYGTDHLELGVLLAASGSLPPPLRNVMQRLVGTAADVAHNGGKQVRDPAPENVHELLRLVGPAAWKLWRSTRRRGTAAPQRILQAGSSERANRAGSDGSGAAAVSPAVLHGLATAVGRRHRLEQRLRDEKLDSLAEFAAAASHEFNNPLSVIYGRAQLLLPDERDPERRRALLTIATQATRIHEMLADLMLFARPPEPHLERVDLGESLTQAAAGYRQPAERQGTSLELTLPDEPLHVSADPVQMQVLIGALIQNALDAIGRGGSVTVTLERRRQNTRQAPARPNREAPEPAVVLRVSDTGPGLTDSERRHLFDPLYSGREAGRGMGLGLAKCWQIVQSHHGRIDVETAPDRGTTIAVILPASMAAQPHHTHTTPQPIAGG